MHLNSTIISRAPVTDELMITRVIYSNISFGQMPDIAFDALIITWAKYLTGETMFFSLWMWQAQFNRKWLQCSIVLE